MSGFGDLVELAERDIEEGEEKAPPDASLLAKEQLHTLVVQRFLAGTAIEDVKDVDGTVVRAGIASSMGLSTGKVRWIISQYQRQIRIEHARTLRGLSRAQEETLLEAREELVGEVIPSIRRLAEIRDTAPADVASRAAIALIDRAGVTPRVGEAAVNPSLEEKAQGEASIPLSALTELRRMVEALPHPVPQAQIPPVPSRILAATATIESIEEAPSE